MNLKRTAYIQIIALIILLSSCATNYYPVSGSYLIAPFSITSNNSKEVVWDKIIDLFAQKGLPIKIIDKSSGLIISEKSTFFTTTETKQGMLVNKNAWLVVPGRFDSIKKVYYKKTNAENLIAEWNVRIKDAPDNKTIVNVNIVNIKDIVTDSHGFTREIIYNNAKSTGVFENLIADLVK